MVFKLGGKYPLMRSAPDNSGIFQDLYSAAAKRIDCTLVITRLPKARLHEGLRKGRYDFYPGASFSHKRAKYLSYIENGIETKELGISSLGIKNITNLSQLKTYSNLIWLMELNSSKITLSNLLGIYPQEVQYMNIDILVNFIQKRPQFNYFYVADKEVIDNFFSNNPTSQINDYGLRIHEECCGESQPMYLGFSRLSIHMKETNNPQYRKGEEISAKNQTFMPAKDSIAQKFTSALKALQKEGITNSVYQHWYPATQQPFLKIE
jgi:hypothetical protein